MSETIVLVFCEPGPMRERPTETLLASRRKFTYPRDNETIANRIEQYQASNTVLLGVGREGCEALGERLAEDGLEGVSAVVLVGPEAPWAERLPSPRPVDCDCEKWCARCEGTQMLCSWCGEAWGRICDPAKHHQGLSLGPLEPLRAVAERAKTGTACEGCGGRGYYLGLDNDCDECGGHGRSYTFCLIIAAHPEPMKCEACGGAKVVGSVGGLDGEILKSTRRERCPVCCGTGKALGSAEVARELAGPAPDRVVLCTGEQVAIPRVERTGSFVVLHYAALAALEEHALGTSLRLALRDD